MTDLEPIDSPETLPGWHMPWPSFTVDWGRAALVVIDLQNYGCNAGCGVAQMLALRYPEIAEYYVPRLEGTVPSALEVIVRMLPCPSRPPRRFVPRSVPTMLVLPGRGKP